MDAAVERQQVVLAQRVELDVAHEHGALAFGGKYAVADAGFDVARVAACEIAQRLRIARRCRGEPAARHVLAEVLDDRTNVLGDGVRSVFELHGLQYCSHFMFSKTWATMRSQRSPAKENASSHATSILAASPSRNRLRARKRRVRTVACGMQSVSAVSSTDISCTARSTNTTR